jgi:predicted O-linked N-acetylglucosamine transferase (SPINDLY family)
MQNNDLNNFYKYIQANQINEANNEINKLLQLDPDNFLFLHCYGFILHKQNNFLEAIKIFKKSIALNEEFLENYFDISLCLINLEMKNEAIFYLKKYINYKKDNCDVYNNLGLLYLENNQLDDATLCFNKCISINLGYVKAYNNLGATLFKKDLIDKAINIIEIGIKFDPKFIDLNINLARCFARKGYYLKAIRILKDLLKNNSDDYNILALIGDYHIKAGKILEGFNFLDKSLKINKDKRLYESKLLNSFCKEDLDLDNYYNDIDKLKKFYNINNKVKLENKHYFFDKQIKIGFVSADFRAHAVGFQILDVIKNLSEYSELKLYLYYNKSEDDDEITKSFKKLNINWINIIKLSDTEVIDKLKHDNLQILIDLSGFTAGGRSNIFYHQPCPVQISWCGYLASTGMEENHYIFADKYSIPLEDESKYSEKIYRLDKTWSVLSKNYNVIANSNIPALKNKFISFGSFNNILKINHKVVSTWSKILCKILNSKLYLFSDNFNEQEFKSYFEKFFLDNGVRLDQLFFQPSLERADLLNNYNLIDIALDTFPYSGGTTSLESYWMGVPVLTKKGDYFISKSTESINKNIGLNDWIANDESDYINKAVNFSNNLNTLQSVKTYLLENRETFAIFDSKDFAKQMFNAFKKLIIKQNA